jgi:hypothetical protein
MRWLRLTVPAAAVAAWLAVSVGQQDAPPATERAEPEEAPPATTPEREESDEVFVPTEELEPDAAVTFPVDI